MKVSTGTKLLIYEPHYYGWEAEDGDMGAPVGQEHHENRTAAAKLRRMELSASVRNGRMFTMIGDDGTTAVIPDPHVDLTALKPESTDLQVRVTVEIFDPPSEQKT